MRVLVAVKRVVDYAATVRVRPDGSGVETKGVKMSMNPFCEIAVEEAVRLKERGAATEVIAATIGPAAAVDVLRTAMALGADSAVHVHTDAELQPLSVAQALAALARRHDATLLLLGKQAIDDDAAQTGPMVAAMLGWPQATFASRVVVEAGRATVAREVDEGTQSVELPLPAVITTDLRLNEPRYAKLPAMLKAKKAPVERVELQELGVDPTAPGVRVLRVDPPPPRAPGVRVGSVDELLAALRQRGALPPA